MQPDIHMAVPRFIIRRAIALDAGGILKCLAAAFEPYCTHYTPAAFLDTVLSPETNSPRRQSMQVFVALSSQSEVIGSIACAIADSNEGHLRGMAVVPRFQGHKIAESLLQAAEEELRRLGSSRITLDTSEPLLRAVRFYERHGYRRSGKVTDFFGMPLHEFVKQF
jgi:ribosomal protein S18 acetylase RimI-like enzyme